MEATPAAPSLPPGAAARGGPLERSFSASRSSVAGRTPSGSAINESGAGGAANGDRISARVIYLACLTTFAGNFVVAMPAPFFPKYAEDHYGATSTQIGFIFAALNAAALLTSPVAGRLCTAFGRRRVLYVGLVLNCGGTCFFGVAQTTWQSALARVTQGAGGACMGVSTMAMMVSTVDDLAAAVAKQEVFTGIGFIVGPPLSGVLFQALGFWWTSFAFAVLPAATLFVVPFLVPPETPGGGQDAGGGWRSVLGNCTVATSCLATLICMSGFGFIDPTLSQHVDLSLDAGSAATGGFMAIGAAMYAVGSILAAPLSGGSRERAVMASGFVCTCSGFLLLGPIPPLASVVTRTEEWVLMVVALLLLGIGCGLGMVPAMPAMRRALGLHQEGGGGAVPASPRTAATEDALSSLLTMALTGGEMLGPVLGGVITGAMPATRSPSCRKDDPPGKGDCDSGFMWASTVMAGLSGTVILLVIAGVRPPPAPASPRGGDGAAATRAGGGVDAGLDAGYTPEGAAVDEKDLKDPLLVAVAH